MLKENAVSVQLVAADNVFLASNWFRCHMRPEPIRTNTVPLCPIGGFTTVGLVGGVVGWWDWEDGWTPVPIGGRTKTRPEATQTQATEETNTYI